MVQVEAIDQKRGAIHDVSINKNPSEPQPGGTQRAEASLGMTYIIISLYESIFLFINHYIMYNL